MAQYVFSAVLHLWHNISVHDAAVKAGDWARQPDWSFWQTSLLELRGKTIGIIGFGRIGRRVGQLAGAVVDVVSTEPIASDNPLLSAKNIAITPYLAWAIREARTRLMASTAEIIRAFISGAPQNIVNERYFALK